MAVDIDKEILAEGSQLHYECEEVLLKDGSRQKDITHTMEDFLFNAWCD